MSKIYVRVTSECDTGGNVIPLVVYWEDGSRFDVDRVLDVRNAASLKAGGYGLRYRVRLSSEEFHIRNRERYLYYEYGLKPERWFVEGKDT